MCWRNFPSALLLFLGLASVCVAEAPKKVLLLAGPGSHGYGAHEHTAGIEVLAKCLQGVPGLATCTHFVGGQWTEGPELIRKADGIVMFMDYGMRWEQTDRERQAA